MRRLALVGLVTTLLAFVGCSGSTPSSPSQAATATVTLASVSLEQPFYTGGCPATLNAVASISGQVSTSGTYQYRYVWERENGQKSAVQSSTFTVASGLTTFGTVERYAMTVAETTSGTLRAHITSPNDVASSSVPFSVTCAAKGSVLSQKTVTLLMSETVDLESGAVDLEPDDLWYEAVTRTDWFLTADYGSAFTVWGSSAPGYAGCSAASLTTRRYSLNQLDKGVYLCWRTWNGHFSQVRLDQPPTSALGAPITLSYTTWY